MTDTDTSEADSLITRRALLKTSGAFGLAVAGSGFLAACGSSSSSTQSSASSSGKISPGVGKELAELLGVTEEDAKLAAGKTWKLGSALPLSGSGASYGKVMAPPIRLAIEQIQLAGGPQIEYTERDHKSGEAAAGAEIARQLGAAGVGAQLTSYDAVLGAELPAMGQYKILTFDGGGSVGPFAGKPYFWGTRAITPNQIFGGQLAWLKQAHPQIKKIYFVYPDEGEETSKGYFASLHEALKITGQELVGSVKYTLGTSDYSAAIRALQSAPSHDLVLLVGYQTDPGYFMKQYSASGLKTQVYGSEYTSQAQEIAGGAYEGFWFAFDYFDYEEPLNPLSKFFVKQWEQKYGPLHAENFYSANYYESTLGLWELVRRVLRAGGDLNSGQALQKALEEKPQLQSVYGGGSSAIGSMVFDTTSHALSKRPCAAFEIKGGKPKLLATFNINPPPTYELNVVAS